MSHGGDDDVNSLEDYLRRHTGPGDGGTPRLRRAIMDQVARTAQDVGMGPGWNWRPAWALVPMAATLSLAVWQMTLVPPARITQAPDGPLDAEALETMMADSFDALMADSPYQEAAVLEMVTDTPENPDEQL